MEQIGTTDNKNDILKVEGEKDIIDDSKRKSDANDAIDDEQKNDTATEIMKLKPSTVKVRLLSNEAASSEFVQKPKSKACINCSEAYQTNSKHSYSNASKSCLGEKLSTLKISRSKCSQLSKNSSYRSLDPCQSFDQCSKCNQVIFATNLSCVSFDSCKICKKSSKNSSYYSCDSHSKGMKVHSVSFRSRKNVDENVSKLSSFCGCSSSLNCDKSCNKELNDCSDSKNSVSNIIYCPPKEPTQISMMKKMFQDQINACSNIETRRNSNKSKNHKYISPTKARRHHIKKIIANSNDLECPSNPCCISDERKERLEIVMNKLIQRETVRQEKIQKEREKKLKNMQNNKCNEIDKCNMDGKCDEENRNNKNIVHCKKYKKMKYEIELQNYIIAKLHRDLQMKIFKNYPKTILIKLKNNVEREIMKLKEMIEFATMEQYRNKDLGWGSIDISSLTSNKIPMLQYSSGPPNSLSCVSNVSAFSILEDIILFKEKEKHQIQCQIKNNRQNHKVKILKEIENLECNLSELKTLQLNFLNGIESLRKNILRNNTNKTKIGANTQLHMKKIKNFIDEAKEDIGNIHVAIHLNRNNK